MKEEEFVVTRKKQDLSGKRHLVYEKVTIQRFKEYAKKGDIPNDDDEASEWLFNREV